MRPPWKVTGDDFFKREKEEDTASDVREQQPEGREDGEAGDVTLLLKIKKIENKKERRSDLTGEDLKKPP